MAYQNDENDNGGIGPGSFGTGPKFEGDDLGNANNMTLVNHQKGLGSGRTAMLANVGGHGKMDAGTAAHMNGTTHTKI